MEHSVEDSWLDFDDARHEALVESAPWAAHPQFFREVYLSGIALMKMALHAESGGNIEVMGLLQGRMANTKLFVKDVFALPVIGTETRVNAAEDAGEFTVGYLSSAQAAGRKENSVGWYHSHPGYGCWLSGIDVATQRLQQNSDPSVAIVVDPHRTADGQIVDIGAFRVASLGTGSRDPPPVHSEKMRDYGAHCRDYYELPLSVYRTPGDVAVLAAIASSNWAESFQSSEKLYEPTTELSKIQADAQQSMKRTLGPMLTKAIYSAKSRECLSRRLAALVRAAGESDAARLSAFP